MLEASSMRSINARLASSTSTQRGHAEYDQNFRMLCRSTVPVHAETRCLKVRGKLTLGGYEIATRGDPRPMHLSRGGGTGDSDPRSGTKHLPSFAATGSASQMEAWPGCLSIQVFYSSQWPIPIQAIVLHLCLRSWRRHAKARLSTATFTATVLVASLQSTYGFKRH